MNDGGGREKRNGSKTVLSVRLRGVVATVLGWSKRAVESEAEEEMGR